MSDITDALAAFKAILAAGYDPTPQDPPAAVYVYPTDTANIDYGTLPIVILAQMVAQEFAWTRWQSNLTRHHWMLEALLLLAEGPITTTERGAPVEATQVDYLLAMADLLEANQSLNGTVQLVGDEELPEFLGQGDAPAQLFTYQIGHIEALNTKVYWGIHFRIPIIQAHGHQIGD